MTRTGKRVCLVAAIAVAIATGGVLVYLWRAPSAVIVTVVNGSRKQVQAVRVEHERGVALIADLDEGQQETVRFPARGETSFTVRVQFLDGSELVSESRYAESGYECRATIGESAIVMETRLPGY